MSSTSSSNSIEDNISRVFNDLEPISLSLLMELDSFAETSVSFQRSLSLEPNTTPEKTNIVTMAGAMDEEVLEVAEEECQSNIPEMPSENPNETNIATLAGAMGEEALEVVEEECQSNIPEMPSETPNETNIATLAGAMGEEALEVAEEECQSNIPEMPSETPNETNIATLAGAMGEEVLEVAEKEYQSNIPEMPSETPHETNISTLAAATSEEAVEVAAAEEHQSIIPAMPSRVLITTPSPATAGSKRGRKKKTKEEKEEFYSRRPDWLPEGWRTEVKVRKDGATSGIRDRYFYEPRTGHRFRSRKEVEKFIQMGEVPRYKPKPKTRESSVVPTSSQNSNPTSSGDMVLPLTLEFYVKNLQSYMSGGRSNETV